MKYRVTCKNCKETDEKVIDDKNNIIWGHIKNIISGRYRLDMKWGWQCICGNNDLVSKQEIREIENLQAPDPSQIAKVLKSIEYQQPKFIMEKQ